MINSCIHQEQKSQLTIGSAGFFLHSSVSPFSNVGVTVLVRWSFAAWPVATGSTTPTRFTFSAG